MPVQPRDVTINSYPSDRPHSGIDNEHSSKTKKSLQPLVIQKDLGLPHNYSVSVNESSTLEVDIMLRHLSLTKPTGLFTKGGSCEAHLLKQPYYIDIIH